MNKLNEDLDKLFTSLTKASAIVEQKDHFPFPIDQLSPYYFPKFVKRILKLIKNNPKINKKNLAGKLKMTTGIRIELLNLLEAAKLANLKKKDRILITKFFIDLLDMICPKNPFGFSLTNPVHTDSEIKKLIKELKFRRADQKTSSLIGEICASLNILSWGLYTDLFPSMFFEYQGPYDVSYKFGRNNILVIRDFVNMKPFELWLRVKDWKFKSITLYAIYKDLDFKIDFFGHHFPDKSTVEALNYFAVLADGKPIENIKELASYLEKIARDQTKKLRELNFKAIKEKFVTIHHYQLKPLFDMVGEDWRPQKDIIKAIKNKRLLVEEEWPPKDMTEKEAFKIYKEYIDPRID